MSAKSGDFTQQKLAMAIFLNYRIYYNKNYKLFAIKIIIFALLKYSV